MDRLPLGSNLYQSLQNQESGKAEQSAPPVSFLSGGVNYELHSTESVRRNVSPTERLGGIMTETILDLETSQKSSVCLVILLAVDAQTSH